MMEAIQAEEMAFQLTTSRRGRLDPEAVVISGREKNIRVYPGKESKEGGRNIVLLC